MPGVETAAEAIMTPSITCGFGMASSTHVAIFDGSNPVIARSS
jgi:hypothetical protein